MTKARDIATVYTTANTANNFVKTDGSNQLPALDGSNLTGVAETKPTISSISPDTITNAQTSITITGANFVSVPQVEFLNPSTGIWYVADTVTFNNSTSLTVQATLTVDAQYKIRIENPNGLAVQSGTILTVSDAPGWTTAAGSLGSFSGGDSISVTVAATNATTFGVQSGSLPGGLSLNTSTGVISGTESGTTSDTTFSFTLRATDAEGQTADRAFTITINLGANNSGQFN